MKVVFDPKPNCLATLTVEVPAERVSAEREKVAAHFQHAAKIPGFRPGKAPRKALETRYARQITEEAFSEVVRQTLNEAIRDQKIHVLSIGKVEAPSPLPDGGLAYRAILVLPPSFELPDYSKIPATITRQIIDDEKVNAFMDQLREPHATFAPVEDRALAMGDFAVISYEGKEGDTPLADVPQQLCGRRNSWLLMEENPLMPGFASALVGMMPDQERTFTIDFGADFPVEPLRGKSVSYAATLHSIQQKSLPALDDELASRIEPDTTADQLREKVRERLEASAEHAFESEKRAAAIKFLLSKVQCELPESFVAKEMRGLLHDIVRENQARGISDEEIQKHQDDIVGAAKQGAVERVRTNFLLLSVARKEGIEATDNELTSLILELAYRYEIPVKKFLSEIKSRGGVEELREQILVRKALDLLAANVTVQPAPDPSA